MWDNSIPAHLKRCCLTFIERWSKGNDHLRLFSNEKCKVIGTLSMPVQDMWSDRQELSSKVFLLFLLFASG